MNVHFVDVVPIAHLILLPIYVCVYVTAITHGRYELRALRQYESPRVRSITRLEWKVRITLIGKRLGVGDF